MSALSRHLVVDGRRVHLLGSVGSTDGTAVGDPEGDLVLLEPGLGAGAASWGAVLDGLAAAGPVGPLQVLAHDRAGYGASDPAGGPRDLGALAAELGTVVAAVPHRRLVLVGHSWGGPVVRTLAADLAAQGRAVAGVVLVDPADELADLYFTPTVEVMNRVQGHAMVLLDRAHLLRRLQRSATRGLPEAHREQAAASVATAAAARTVREEARHITRGLRHLRLDPPDLRGVPLTVISGRHPEGLGRRLRDELTAAHRERAGPRPGAGAGRFVAAERSGHLVPVDQPELVVEEILRLLG
ncbi:alpha/beta fold hydrolase [Brachybacterium sp. SGAir0954]|uniref:alpha/beta fold hydrolase n=1 Tax=Brachybacterium sp. SGAir0954 TaxID=2571029 RepID=UPI00143DBFB3|nr:alpha/beta hydrolase [Brachybacterium sp. SGAir0954]